MTEPKGLLARLGDKVDRPLSIVVLSSFLAVIGVLSAALILRQASSEDGDALITLVFAKSMWREGLFYFGADGPQGGATGPVWAFLLSLFYLPSDDPHIAILRIPSFLFFTGTGVLLGIITLRLSRSVAAASIATALWLINPVAQGYGAQIYETSLATFLLVAGIYSSLRVLDTEPVRAKKWVWLVIWAVSLGFLPLTRPDMVPFSFCLAGFVLFSLRKRKASKHYVGYVAAALIAFIVPSTFYIWLWSQTGQLIPASVNARSAIDSGGFALRQVAISILPPVPGLWYAFLYSTVYVTYGLGTLMLFHWWGLGRFRNHTRFLLLLVGAAVVFGLILVLGADKRFIARYLFPLAIVLTLLSSLGIYYTWRMVRSVFVPTPSSLTWTLGVVVTVVLALGLFSMLAATSVADNRSMVSTNQQFRDYVAIQLNELAGREDRVLLSEVQMQYLLNSQVLSMDGVIGGEITPHLRNGSDLVGFLLEERPDYIVADTLLAKPRHMQTILGELWRTNPELAPEEQFAAHGIVFTKVLDGIGPPEDKVYLRYSIYRITYE